MSQRDPSVNMKLTCHSHAAFPAVLLAGAPVVSFEFFEFGTDRKLTALVRHDDPIRFSRLLGRGELRRARWVASRRNGSRHPRTFLLLLTCPASGSTLCMPAGRPVASCSTWIRASARPIASRRTASGTAITIAPAITRCSSSTSSAIWNAVRCVLAMCAQARRGALPGQSLTHLFPSGRGLCNARGLPVSGGGADQIRDPATQVLQSTSVLQEGRENANIDASLGFIWRISVYNFARF
jgi:hypothetical protein